VKAYLLPSITLGSKPRNKSAHKEHDYQRFAPIPKTWTGGANQHMTNHKQ